jgi:hypothetical protein
MTSSWDWAEYNTLAQQMLNIVAQQPFNFSLVSNDAIYRCIVSRAYYSAHCQSVKYLGDVESDFPLTDVSIHVWTINRFNPSIHRFDSSIKKIKGYIYDDLSFLRNERVAADYKYKYPDLNLAIAKACVKRSDFVYKRLIELSNLSN